VRQAAHGEAAARLFGSRPEARLALLRAAWTQAVGAELGRRTELLAVEEQTLRVRVPDARWRRVLHRMQPDLLARLRATAGALAPRRLGFTEGGLAAPVAACEPPATALPEPAASETVRAAAASIDDLELRGRFVASAERYLSRPR
jgi:hypothetical protein